MKLQRVLNYAQFLLKDTVEAGDIAIDATAGNGHDTALLAELVGENGHVYAFDVQQQAVDSTIARLTTLGFQERCDVILDGHEKVAHYVTAPIKAAVFNLGYLPGADHSVVTKPSTTVMSLEAILKQLVVGGIIVLVIYHGHEGGKEERDRVIDFTASLPQKQINVLRYEFINQKNDPPFIIALEKLKEFPSS